MARPMTRGVASARPRDRLAANGGTAYGASPYVDRGAPRKPATRRARRRRRSAADVTRATVREGTKPTADRTMRALRRASYASPRTYEHPPGTTTLRHGRTAPPSRSYSAPSRSYTTPSRSYNAPSRSVQRTVADVRTVRTYNDRRGRTTHRRDVQRAGPRGNDGKARRRRLGARRRAASLKPIGTRASVRGFGRGGRPGPLRRRLAAPVRRLPDPTVRGMLRGVRQTDKG